MRFAEISYERIQHNFFSEKENESLVAIDQEIVKTKGVAAGTVYGKQAVMFIIPHTERIQSGLICSVSFFDQTILSFHLESYQSWTAFSDSQLKFDSFKEFSYPEESVLVFLCTIRVITQLQGENQLIIASIERVLSKLPKYRDRFLGCSEPMLSPND